MASRSKKSQTATLQAGDEVNPKVDAILAAHGPGSSIGMPDPALREAQKAMELSTIGKRQPRLDGPLKVSGRSFTNRDTVETHRETHTRERHTHSQGDTHTLRDIHRERHTG